MTETVHDEATPSESSSVAYRLANLVGLRLAPQFANVSFIKAFHKLVIYYWREWLHNLARFSILFGPFGTKVVRPKLYAMRGSKIGNNVFIGHDVFIDPVYPEQVTIEEGAYVTARVLILCHNRDLQAYKKGMWIGDCPHIVRPVHIGRGAHIGMGSILLPGVTIGEGAVVGAGAVVTKDIPPYSIAVGVPAKVIRQVQE